ncbi:MAG: serine/threonine protein kinase [Xanthomonadales bacterium]|nr:serine/threonine protein kinase [Xanthomonadales bacterium]
MEVLRLLDGALARPPAERVAWLAAQGAPVEVVDRVRALLGGEAAMGGFMDEPIGIDATRLRASQPEGGGERLGAWRIVRELDAGGMGVVYLGERADGTYEQQVAIKLMRVAPLAGARERAEFAARFDNERRLLARVDHPNVARILDGGSTADGVPYLVMEYVDGVALTAWCDRQRLDVAARVALFCKVCDGVQAAHRHLIVHRDLKPGNILVGADGEPRLLDFGIARAIEAGAGGTAEPTLVGAMTPAYASPEQVRHEPLTTASDVYSLGIILYELLSGKRPYSLEGLSPAQSERVVCDTEPPTLRRALAASTLASEERRTRVAGIGNDLERIVARALHKEPARRYESARALAEDLRRWLEGRPVLAHPDSAGYRLRRFVLRHRVGSAVAALAAAAILAAVAVALLQARQARQAAADTGLVNTFLLDIINTSNPYGTGSELTLSEALDEAVGKVDARFAGRTDLAIDIRNALGQSLYSRYRLAEAEAQFERARSDGEALFGPDDPRVVTAIGMLANIRKEQDRSEEAKALFDEALVRMERSGQAGSALHAGTLSDIGVMYLILENPAEARKYLQRAVDADRGGDAPDSADQRARTLANLAQAERGLGNLDRADELYARAQPILESVYPNGGPHVAILLNNRARLAWARGRREQALLLQKQAVAMHQSSFNGDHVMVLVPMTNLARMALDSDQPELSAEWAEKAVAMAARLYPERSHHYQINAIAALAGVRLVQRRRNDAAVLLERARTLMSGVDAVPASTRDYVGKLVTDTCAAKGPRLAALCDTGR